MKIQKEIVFNAKRYAFLSDDSRELDSDTLFVRTKRNSVFFVPESIDAAKLIEYYKPLPNLVGITGTNGKTTTAALIYSLLLDMGYSCALIGTRGVFKNDIQIRPKGLTTPGVLELYAILESVKECDFAIMEVSSHAIHQDRIAGLTFCAKVLTNITSDHLDYHKTIEEYIRVKNSFFADETLKIINADEPRAYCNPSNLYTYGIESNANLKVNAYSLDHPMCAHIRYNPFYGKQAKNLAPQEQSEETLIEVPLYGKHNLYNVLGALLCVKRLCMEPALCSNLDLNSDISISIESIAKKLENFGGVEGRMEVVSQNPLVIVDFAHTHDGMRQIFESFKTKKIVVLFGAGGDRDATKRPKMGKIAQQYAHRIYLTSDNPRSENKESIIAQIASGMTKEAHCIIEPDRRAAIWRAIAELQEDEVLLVLGKGDEKYQIIGTTQYPFDDKEEILNALQRVKGGSQVEVSKPIESRF